MRKAGFHFKAFEFDARIESYYWSDPKDIIMTIETKEKLQRYLTYLEQDKGNKNLCLSVSETYLDLNDWVGAQYYLDVAKEISGESLSSYQGTLYLKSNQIEAAIKAFQMALKENDLVSTRYYLAFSLYLNHQFEGALNILTSSTDLSIHPESNRLKARLYHHLQLLDDGIASLEEVMLHYSNDADSAGYLSLLYFDTANAEKAELYSELALSIQPDNKEGLLVKSLLKALKGNLTSDEIAPLLSVLPQEGRLLFLLGTTQLQEQNLVKAEQSFIQLSDIWPDFYDNWICLGWVYLLQNELDKAMSAYQQATMLDQEAVEGWGGLALTNVLLNNIPLAEKYAEKSDRSCFLTKLTRLMLANQDNPAEISRLFNDALPKIVDDMKKKLFVVTKKDETIH